MVFLAGNCPFSQWQTEVAPDASVASLDARTAPFIWHSRRSLPLTPSSARTEPLLLLLVAFGALFRIAQHFDGDGVV